MFHLITFILIILTIAGATWLILTAVQNVINRLDAMNMKLLDLLVKRG